MCRLVCLCHLCAVSRDSPGTASRAGLGHHGAGQDRQAKAGYLKIAVCPVVEVGLAKPVSQQVTQQIQERKDIKHPAYILTITSTSVLMA